MSNKKELLVVGCGITGLTFARLAAEAGIKIHIIDLRNHIGGNCYSFKDDETGIEIHRYGPHIFHTNNKNVWNFINRYADFHIFYNNVKAISGNNVYSFPINLHTINQFFKTNLDPIKAKSFIDKTKMDKKEKNFEDFLLNNIGEKLYEAFYKHYTLKQWGIEPRLLPEFVAKRIPIRFNYNDNYYDDKYQGIPNGGYGLLFKRMSEHENIRIDLKTSFEDFRNTWRNKYKKLIYTGSIDDYFQFSFGKMSYRAIALKEIRDTEIQGNAVINYCDMSVPYTRIHEHKWFLPSKKYKQSVGFIESTHTAKSIDEYFYPMHDELSTDIHKKYKELTFKEKNVIFVGRLAEYKYYNMDHAIFSCMKKFNETKNYI